MALKKSLGNVLNNTETLSKSSMIFHLTFLRAPRIRSCCQDRKQKELTSLSRIQASQRYRLRLRVPTPSRHHPLRHH